MIWPFSRIRELEEQVQYRDLVIAMYEAEVKLHKIIRKLDNKGNPFTQEDIARLLRLCHPDKHGNSEAANAMTKKLLSMRQSK